jgi:hypothetical protein
MAESTSSTMEIMQTRQRHSIKRVGICGVPPSAAGGLVRALVAGGLQGEIVGVPVTKPSTDGLCAMVIAAGEDRTLLSTLRLYKPALVLIAYLPKPSTAAIIHYRGEAAGVIDADMSHIHAVRVIRLAIERTTSATNGEIFRPSPARPSPHQLAWLHALAGGITVANLADKQGRSLRTMRRQLQQLYRLLDVSTLRGALAWHQKQQAYESG